MKWLLLQPEYNFNIAFPLSLAQVATHLKSIGEEVLCYDLNINKFSDILLDLKNFKPDVIGFSITSITEKNANEISLLLKKEFVKTPIIYGGVGAITEYKRLLNEGYADFCFINEIEVIQKSEINTLKQNMLKNVSGFAYKENNNIVVNTSKNKSTISDYSFPLRKLSHMSVFDYQIPQLFTNESTTLITSRGCPYNCSYCASKRISGNNVVYQSAKKVIEELDYLREIGINNFIFEDYEFLGDKRRLVKICDNMLKNNSKWIIKIRIDNINEQIVKRISESGCVLIYIGVETLTETALKLAHKTTVNVLTIKNAVKLLKKYNIKICASIQFGLPGDSEKEFKKNTVDFLADVLDPKKDKVQLHFTTLFPGTELYNRYHNEGVKIELHKNHPDVIAHGLEGLVMPCLNENKIENIYKYSNSKLGDLLSNEAIWTKTKKK